MAAAAAPAPTPLCRMAGGGVGGGGGGWEGVGGGGVGGSFRTGPGQSTLPQRKPVLSYSYRYMYMTELKTMHYKHFSQENKCPIHCF